MANLADVNFSISGEPGAKALPGKSFSGLVEYDSKTKHADKEWVIFKLVDNNRNGGVIIDSIDDVKNPDTGNVERVRLLSGVSSIWMKDQKDIAESYVRGNRIELKFHRGNKFLRVSKNHPQAIQFLRLCNSNIGNKDRIRGTRHEFFEYDSAIAEKEAYQLEELQLDAQIKAKQAKLDPMRKHCAFLGITLVNELGEPKGEDGLRRDYVRYAKNNPDYFIKTFGAKEIETGWLVRKAVAEGKIDVSREPGKAYWANGGGMISAYPTSQNPTTFLIDLANTQNQEGKQFLDQLQNLS